MAKTTKATKAAEAALDAAAAAAKDAKRLSKTAAEEGREEAAVARGRREGCRADVEEEGGTHAPQGGEEGRRRDRSDRQGRPTRRRRSSRPRTMPPRTSGPMPRRRPLRRRAPQEEVEDEAGHRRARALRDPVGQAGGGVRAGGRRRAGVTSRSGRHGRSLGTHGPSVARSRTRMPAIPGTRAYSKAQLIALLSS